MVQIDLAVIFLGAKLLVQEYSVAIIDPKTRRSQKMKYSDLNYS